MAGIVKDSVILVILLASMNKKIKTKLHVKQPLLGVTPHLRMDDCHS